eukprot:scaffold1233_cov395-Prasinococcus_capsulatus_cf.AAC.16
MRPSTSPKPFSSQNAPTSGTNVSKASTGSPASSMLSLPEKGRTCTASWPCRPFLKRRSTPYSLPSFSDTMSSLQLSGYVTRASGWSARTYRSGGCQPLTELRLRPHPLERQRRPALAGHRRLARQRAPRRPKRQVRRGSGVSVFCKVSGVGCLSSCAVCIRLCSSVRSLFECCGSAIERPPHVDT